MIDFLILLGVFTLIDAVWLGKVSPAFYKRHIGHIMRKPPDWTAALLFYVGYIAGLYFLALEPSDSTQEALIMGGALGLFAYATYDLTNKATLEGWPWTLVAVDLMWGMFISAASVAITFAIVS